jgi:hypothetical protein
MKLSELCMKYDTCKRCPMNRKCEAEYQKQLKVHSTKGDAK